MRCCGGAAVRRLALRTENAPDCFVREIARMDHLERDFATQVGVERLVGDAHATAAEFNWLAITAIDELILVEPPARWRRARRLRHPARCAGGS